MTNPKVTKEEGI